MHRATATPAVWRGVPRLITTLDRISSPRNLPPPARPVVCAAAAGAAGTRMATLESLAFDNRALRSLPVDKEEQNFERPVNGAFYSRVSPTPLSHPRLVAHSQPALDLLLLSPSEAARPEFPLYFSGSQILPGSQPAAHCYCGHQFGYYSGQLGDGCAHSLGEVVNSATGERWELQLKGSGKTPYSRHADGRKVLRSSIREFLCSEAIHYLGIPTTRAGSCVTSDDRVARDIHYDGRTTRERATVISRIAPTFLRFGSFEVFKARDGYTGRAGPSVGRTDLLHLLLDYTTQHFFTEIHTAHADDRTSRTAAFFNEVCRRTARLVALWQCVGFCHGVLNTDNMSIVGLTLDYGPFGFLDRYDPGKVFNSSDTKTRYAYGRQPEICRWNLGKLAEALLPVLPPDSAQEGLRLYDTEFENVYLNKMRAKIGLIQTELPDDSDLIESFLDTLLRTGCDFTNGFRCLSHVESCCDEADCDKLAGVVEHFLAECASPEELVATFKPLLSQHHLQMFSALMAESPGTLQALDLTPQIIAAEVEKHKSIAKLKGMSLEDKRTQDRDLWLAWLKTYRQRLLHEFEGTESTQIRKAHCSALEVHNPKFILRTHILQRAIELAEKDDFSEVQQLLKLVQSPYSSDLPSPASQDPKQPSQSSSSEQATSASTQPSQGHQDTSGLAETQREPLSAHPAEALQQHYFGRPPQWALGLALS